MMECRLCHVLTPVCNLAIVYLKKDNFAYVCSSCIQALAQKAIEERKQ